MMKNTLTGFIFALCAAQRNMRTNAMMYLR